MVDFGVTYLSDILDSHNYISMDESLVQIFSDALSTATILSCLFLKVPQIQNIRKNKSAKGIYVQAMLMEITGFTIVTLYNYVNRYSIMTYLEYPIILLQLYIMLYYVLKYKRQLTVSIVPIATIAYAVVILAFVNEILPKTALSYMLPFTTPLSGFAKVTYIYGIINAANADTVSLTTWCISVGTNLSRLFTVYVDSADLKLMCNFTISAILSGSVLLTAMYYKNQMNTTQRKRRGSQRPHDD